MNIELITEILGWCVILNFGLLLWWFVMLLVAHDWVYKIHSRWFKLTEERFDAIHYAGLAFFKIATFILYLAPYVALKICS